MPTDYITKSSRVISLGLINVLNYFVDRCVEFY